ncbi:MAG: T9SS type A sorting domain-containing protein [Bacteroidota bacterium]
MKKSTCIFFAGLSSLFIPMCAQQLSIQNETSWVASGNVSLVLSNMGFDNDGTFEAGSSTISFTGDVLPSPTLTGEEISTFYNLEIAVTNEEVELDQDIAIDGQLQMTQGSMDIGDFDVDLGLDGVLTGHTESKRIFSSGSGTLIKTADLNAPAGVDVGGLGLTFTSADNLGSTEVRLGFDVQNGNSIERVYEVIVENNTGINVSLVFSYFDAELNGLEESAIRLFQNDGSGWEQLVTIGDAVANTLAADVTGFSSFTAFTDVLLPVQLVQFNGKRATDGTVLLQWTTASEKENDGFEVQESLDGSGFAKIGWVNGAGDSQQAIDYAFSHKQSQSAFYRLRQVDFDGTEEYSSVVYVDALYPPTNLSVFPNPTRGIAEVNQGSKAMIYSASGQLVRTIDLDRSGGKLHVSDLTPGIYQILLFQANGTYIDQSKMVKR